MVGLSSEFIGTFICPDSFVQAPQYKCVLIANQRLSRPGDVNTKNIVSQKTPGPLSNAGNIITINEPGYWDNIPADSHIVRTEQDCSGPPQTPKIKT